MRNINLRIEKILHRQGFFLHDFRTLLRNQIYLLFLAFVIMLLAGFHPAALAFASGTALVTVNFWFLAKGLQSLTRQQEGLMALSLIRFYGRMILTGFILFALIVWSGLPVAALVAGLTTVIINILFWGVFRFHRQKVKEA
ncbi:ATP synthase I chain [Desulfonatronum thiosulfatophilum]|uniref:ATP synthase I chain n=1 Tax=Desulfonatronum thiosulfatophilum TaxID=617002 RepID=A0A1G6C299_9BACT|nr:ATP synthase subunit I [Desulfonatronum thiosulfatophilum]SDB26977.1 ATP synthase I chain [Desulfonatronum thiosulfatophilum]